MAKEKINGKREIVQLEVTPQMRENFEIIRRSTRQELPKNTDIVRYAIGKVTEDILLVKG